MPREQVGPAREDRDSTWTTAYRDRLVSLGATRRRLVAEAGMTGIEWTDEVWNPVTGCSKVSPGCANCYAETMAKRLAAMGRDGYTDLAWTPANAERNVVLRPDRLEQPLRWRRPRRVFVNSMSDLFHELVPFGFVMRAWWTMLQARRHTFQVLTKRPERMREFFVRWMDLEGESQDLRLVRGPEATRAAHPSGRGQLFADMLESMGEPPPGAAYPTFDWLEGPRWWPRLMPRNVWLGTSIENDRHTFRADHLRETPAAVRFISAEPLLGPLPSLDLTGIDWLIIGGESGPNHRPMDPAWAAELVDNADRAGTTVFVKQDSGRHSSSQGRLPDHLWARKEWPA